MNRLEKAIELAQKEVVDGIIVSGGTTRKNCEAESVFGVKYLQSKTNAKILSEEHSHTTVENIIFTKNILSEYAVNKIIVISSKKRLFRIKYLYQRLWPEMRGKINFVGANDSYGMYFYFLEVIYLIYSIFDINELLLPRLTKKLFRNS